MTLFAQARVNLLLVQIFYIIGSLLYIGNLQGNIIYLTAESPMCL